MGAMLSGHNPQHPTTELGAQALLQTLAPDLSQDRRSLQVKQQLNSCFQLVDVLPAWAGGARKAPLQLSSRNYQPLMNH